LRISAESLLAFRSLCPCENDTPQNRSLGPFGKLKPARRSPKSFGPRRPREHVYLWKKKYGGLGTPEIRELRQLCEETVKLKKLVADLSLDRQMLQMAPNPRLSAKERHRCTAESLEHISMSHRTRHFPAQLFGRSAAAVAVARAIAGEPAVLLADEPTRNLGLTNGELVMELLADLHRAGSTLVMVTHDRRFIRTPAGRSICSTARSRKAARSWPPPAKRR